MEFKFEDVNDAFVSLVGDIHEGFIPTQLSQSRNGPVIKVAGPVLLEYLYPQRRVLFNAARDCNPFFHLFEALWMLAGRNDIAPLVYYNPRMAEYSDDEVTLHGAYGYRWRQGTSWGNPRDQLRQIANALRQNPNCRRQVLSVWDRWSDLAQQSKDLPCNTHAYFSVRCEDVGDPGEPDASRRVLDMTVCNRSNDLVWGMLGANYVHWSMLQEYMAALVGVELGTYYHFTNNLHIYTAKAKFEEWLAADKSGVTLYPRRLVSLVQDPKRFDVEVKQFIDCIDGEWEEPFLRTVAQPMMAAFRAHKARRYRGDQNAFILVNRVEADDWRQAGQAWLTRRRIRWEMKG